MRDVSPLPAPSAHGPDNDHLTCLDMSVVSDTYVAKALRSLLTQWRMKKRWDVFPADTRQLHSDILHSYVATSGPPDLAALDATLIDDLVARDLVVLGSGGIAAAYPFSTAGTRHTVTLGGRDISAVCAIDALGTGAMVGRSAQVRSSCPVCDAGIEIGLTGNGLVVASVFPESSCLWAGIVPIEGCAATTQCRAMLLFCSQDHLAVWQKDHAAPPDGFALSVPQAVQAGAAIFRRFLEPGR